MTTLSESYQVTRISNISITTIGNMQNKWLKKESHKVSKNFSMNVVNGAKKNPNTYPRKFAF